MPYGQDISLALDKMAEAKIEGHSRRGQRPTHELRTIL